MPEVAPARPALDLSTSPLDGTRVDVYLRAFLSQTRKRHAANPHVLTVYDRAAEFVLRGGKRLRPRLALAGYRIIRGDDSAPPRPVWLVAASLELFHAFMLVHDDLIDASPIRRGEPSLHEELRIDLDVRSNGSGCGEGRAADLGLIAGDLLFAIGMRLIGRSGLEAESLVRVHRLTSDILLDTGLGEALDVLYGDCPLDRLTEADVIDAYVRKTARYSVSGPLILGATLAGAGTPLVKALRRFGDLLGLGFQLQNDLDALASEDPSEDCPDLDGGKRTWPLWRAYHNLDEPGRRAIRRALEMPIGPDRRAVLFERIHESGAIDQCRSRLQALRRDAVAELREAPLDPSQRRAFLALVDLFPMDPSRSAG